MRTCEVVEPLPGLRTHFVLPSDPLRPERGPSRRICTVRAGQTRCRVRTTTFRSRARTRCSNRTKVPASAGALVLSPDLSRMQLTIRGDVDHGGPGSSSSRFLCMPSSGETQNRLAVSDTPRRLRYRSEPRSRPPAPKRRWDVRPSPDRRDVVRSSLKQQQGWRVRQMARTVEA